LWWTGSYVTQRPNDVLAVDAKTGRVFWQYRYNVSPDARVCCGANNRGVAILGDTLYTGTLDGHLVALDKTTGRSLWDVAVGDPKQGYSITMAPLIVKDKVLVGSGGANTAFAASLPPSTRRAGTSCGASTPFQDRERKATTHGPAIPGSRGERPSG
jgi:outer membrane protein assembly factor BamB